MGLVRFSPKKIGVTIPGRRKLNRPLLKSEILGVQADTNSGKAAAMALGVNFTTYKKYAKLYGIYEPRSGHPAGQPHFLPKWHPPLEEIFDGKHPKYNLFHLKKRLLAAGLLDEECSVCGFNERRVIDYRVPLCMIFKDGNKLNRKLDNIALVCLNHAFTLYGKYSFKISTRLLDKVLTPTQDITPKAMYDHDVVLTQEEIDKTISEARAELPQDE